MMRNLETEYKKLTNESVPDLWDRIEAGIDNLEPKVVNIDKNIKANKKRKINRIIPTIAAAAVLLLSCGVYAMMNSSKSMEAGSAMMAADTTSDTASEDFSYVEEAAESTYEEIMDSEAYAEEAYAEEADAEEVDASEMKNSASALKTMEDAEEEAVNLNSYYGIINGTSRNRVVRIDTEDGSVMGLYVTDEFKDIIIDAVKDSKNIYIEYEAIDENMREEITSKYDDISFYITAAEIK